jgi:hypothetical protein
MTTGNKDVPRVFALVRDAEEPNQIVGYGMVLPDGAAYAVSCQSDAAGPPPRPPP